MIARRVVMLIVCAAVTLVIGCVTETEQPNRVAGPTKTRVSTNNRKVPPEFNAGGANANPNANVNPGAAAVNNGRAELDSITSNDPCGNRVHELAGVMLLYYAVHHQLPATLEELRSVADADQDLHFTCPVSGKPYIYEPAGLVSGGNEERLVLFDPEPTHKGARWGVVAAPPHGLRPATASATLLPEAMFKRYALPINVP